MDAGKQGGQAGEHKMHITLRRVAENNTGTYGVLLLDGHPACVTLEDRWQDNAKNISCIPAGTYKCKEHNGTKFKGVWEITGVPKRAAILIHAGNSHHDTNGCVLVGRSFAPFGIQSSQEALDTLRKLLPDTFTLTITGVPNE